MATPIATPAQEPSKPTPSTDTKRAEKRRKSSAATLNSAKKPDTETELVDIDKLPAERKRVADQLSKIISDDVNSRVKAATYRIPDGHTATSLGQHHAARIEYALYMNYGPFVQSKATEPYANQFRALNANLKRNAMLIDRMLKSDLTADELAVMKPEDMASEEEQKKRAALREEVQKQSVMVQEEEDRPRVRRTHKGDEYVDDDSQQPIEQTVFNPAPVRHRGSEADITASAPTTAQPPNLTAASPDRMDIDQPAPDSAQDNRRTSTKEFDIENVWGKTQHPPEAGQHQQTRLLQEPARRRSSIQRQTQQEKGEKVDAEVDRLLEDEDDDYTPDDFTASDGGVVWRGELVQPGVTQLIASGRFVSGNDFGRYTPWADFLPKILEIEGRLEAKRADDYLCGLQWSKKSDVAVLALTPYDNREAFDQIFDYFSSRSRYAVIRKGHGMSDIVKDVYITPVPAGGPLPPHLMLLEHNSLDPALPERVLIVTFVVNKPPHWDNPATAPIPYDVQVGNGNGNPLPPHLRNGSAASPVNGGQPAAPVFSPRPDQGFTPVQGQNGNYPNSLPPNPYSAAPSTTVPTTPQWPTQQQQQQPTYNTLMQILAKYPAAPPHSNPMVARILGLLVNAPTIQFILTSAGDNIAEQQLEGMKQILHQDPTAAEDLNRFRMLLGVNGAPAGQ